MVRDVLEPHTQLPLWKRGLTLAAITPIFGAVFGGTAAAAKPVHSCDPPLGLTSVTIEQLDDPPGTLITARPMFGGTPTVAIPSKGEPWNHSWPLPEESTGVYRGVGPSFKGLSPNEICNELEVGLTFP